MFPSSTSAAAHIDEDANNVAIVTGSSRGIGAAVAERLAQDGFTVVRHMFDAAEAAFGGVDVLVNNAGIMQLSKVADTTDELFDRQVAVNLKGVFNGLREAAKRLRNGGRIISFSSSVVGLYQPTYAVYAATKAGVEAMTHVLAKELRGRNITVNAVAPGPTATDLFLKNPPEVIDRLAKLTPLEPLGQPHDIANTVAFLAGPDGGWINGQVLRANGGII
jgi:3-oxoacyl-[acyl-carrier protein] reductase